MRIFPDTFSGALPSGGVFITSDDSSVAYQYFASIFFFFSSKYFQHDAIQRIITECTIYFLKQIKLETLNIEDETFHLKSRANI